MNCHNELLLLLQNEEHIKLGKSHSTHHGCFNAYCYHFPLKLSEARPQQYSANTNHVRNEIMKQNFASMSHEWLTRLHLLRQAHCWHSHAGIISWNTSPRFPHSDEVLFCWCALAPWCYLSIQRDAGIHLFIAHEGNPPCQQGKFIKLSTAQEPSLQLEMDDSSGAADPQSCCSPPCPKQPVKGLTQPHGHVSNPRGGFDHPHQCYPPAASASQQGQRDSCWPQNPRRVLRVCNWSSSGTTGSAATRVVSSP